MKFLLKLAAIGMVLSMSGYSQILENNVQFTDMEGKSYDLYDLLDNGKYLFIEMLTSG